MVYVEVDTKQEPCVHGGCQRLADMFYFNYSEDNNIRLCRFHAQQLARMLLEDICAVWPEGGGRHG